MQNVLDNFSERVDEVEKYYKVLQLLNNDDVSIIKKNRSQNRRIQLDNDVLKVMKSTCFLVLYNLIESCVRESFTYLYDSINSESSFINVYKKGFKKVWINQHFKIIDPTSSNQNTYREIATEMINKILASESFFLNSDKLPIAGNLDARKIRELFNSHNIKLTIHHQAFGGAELKTVKDKRNDLAHGNVSFCECGREYSVDDLVNIKKQTVIYLRSTLRNMKKFVDERKYAE